MEKKFRKKRKSFESQKEKMMSKASVLFWKKGYQGTSMRDIAKAYGCKPANIYNYFPSKESILHETLQEQMQQLILLLKPLHEKDLNPIEQLRLLIKNHLTHTLSYKKSYKILFDVGLDYLSPAKRNDVIALRDEYDKILRQIIRNGIESEDFGKVDEKLAVYSIASMIVRTIIWYSSHGRLSIDQITEFIFNFALNGLKGSK
jgi:AcrR family transcriptional regulator